MRTHRSTLLGWRSTSKPLKTLSQGAGLSRQRGKTNEKGAGMKIFVAGATGALGKPLVTQLVRRGHEVTGMTRSESKQDSLRELGARPVVADALDPDAVARAIAEAGARRDRPRAHGDTATSTRAAWSATSPPRTGCVRRAPTTSSPPGARWASSASARRARSLAVRPHGRHGQERGRSARHLRRPSRSARRSRRSSTSRQAVTGADWTEGIALRYGGFYGPGTSIGLDPLGEQIEMIRARKFPLAGKGERRMVVHPHRQRRGRYGRGDRARQARRLQRGRRRAGTGLRVAARAREGGRRQAAPARAALALRGSQAATLSPS